MNDNHLSLPSSISRYKAAPKMMRFLIQVCKLTCNDAENNISNPSCFLILSHLSSQSGNLEYFVPRMSCRNEAIRPGI